MATTRTENFRLDLEVKKLQRILRLPITEIVFEDKYEYGKLYLNADKSLNVFHGNLYVNETSIGTIPFKGGPGGPLYDVSRENELAWDKVYTQFYNLIFNQIIHQQPLAATLKPRSLRLLNVEDKDARIINVAYCNYINEAWNIVLGDPNPREYTCETKTEIVVPRNLFGTRQS